MTNKKDSGSSPKKISRRKAIKHVVAGASGITFAHLLPAQAADEDSLPGIVSFLLDEGDACPEVSMIEYSFSVVDSKRDTQFITVPEGATSADMVIKGAGGGSADAAGGAAASLPGAAGGNGGMVSVDEMPINSGDELEIEVGRGGFPGGVGGGFGGGFGGETPFDNISSFGPASGAGGGGYSSVLNLQESVRILAGGGGGSGGGNSITETIGGAGGVSTPDGEVGDGSSGQGAVNTFGGAGNGGGGGAGNGAGLSGSAGTVGAAFEGGAGGGNSGASAIAGGGGGGGGGGGLIGGSGGGAGGGDGETISGGGGGGGGGGLNSVPAGGTAVVDGGGAGGIAASAGGIGESGGDGSVQIVFKGAGITPTVPVVATGLVDVSGPIIEIIESKVVSDGGCPVTQRGVVFTTSFEEAPTIENSDANAIAAEAGIGSFIISVPDAVLSISNNFLIRAYAINEVGITYGGAEAFSVDT